MNAHIDTLSVMSTDPVFGPSLDVTADDLHAIMRADSSVSLWDEVRDFGCRAGMRELHFIELVEQAKLPHAWRHAASGLCDVEALRQALMKCNGKLLCIDGETVVLPAFGPRGLEAALLVRLDAGAALNASTDILCAIFQLAYARQCQICPAPVATDMPLSQREREIMRWVMRGKSNSVIGAILGISASTVDTHLRRIFRKLDVADRTSAAMRAAALGAVC